MATGSGQLDRRIVIQENLGTGPDAVGQEDETWTTTATVWASLRNDTGDETFGEQQHSAKQKVIFRIRWRPKVGPKHRIIHDSFVYEITDVAEVERRKFLDISAFAREKASQEVS